MRGATRTDGQVSLLQKCAPHLLSRVSGAQSAPCPDWAQRPSSQLLSASTPQAPCIGPFPVRGEAPSRASQGARSAGIPGWAHITVRAPLPPQPLPPRTPAGPDPSPQPAAGSAGLPSPLSSLSLGPGTPSRPGGARRPSFVPCPAHRAPSHPTFSGEVSPGPAGGRRFS